MVDDDVDINIGSQSKDLFEDRPLSVPSKEQLRNAFSKIKELLLVDKETIRNIISNLVSGNTSY